MNIQLHRKQIFILIIAMALAIASYWIPSPRQLAPVEAESSLSEPVRNPMSVESATTRRFPEAERVPPTGVQPASAVKTGYLPSAPELPPTRLPKSTGAGQAPLGPMG
ncbi:MAG TPA: hypothetical protein GX399_03085 [Xanthomonadaceae bacterium]|nr:hypothetical protein [Xanthomonadaceae bacterium]